ncbi:lipocalin-like domain-containing protein [Streptomyces sp. AM8-1-1]|uniref:lipocalin-like domain-containing protein n=1 Tax=Streptomyces sp. AM8-1-1 TaxID=3075825 RepID=UPI0028C47604|nr:lipocalin-like domain-containing protein [Streptomyces sp. AM8-1-1]WNO76889.1 lipocalin-like domain-containing protein [Streptomyces sp. AM8-1-1]
MDSLIGAWVLEDFSLTREGTVVHPLGERPSGALLYTADGWMSALLTAHPEDAPAASAFEEIPNGTVAYAGRWEREADGPVMHHIQASHYTPWTGTALVRDVQLSPGRLELTAAGADESQIRLLWRRADA